MQYYDTLIIILTGTMTYVWIQILRYPHRLEIEARATTSCFVTEKGTCDLQHLVKSYLQPLRYIRKSLIITPNSLLESDTCVILMGRRLGSRS